MPLIIERREFLRIWALSLSQLLASACGVPTVTKRINVTNTSVPTETLTPTPTSFVTEVFVPRPKPTLIPVEAATSTPTIIKPTEIRYVQYDRWISGNEPIMKGIILPTVDDCNDEVFLKQIVDAFEENGIDGTFFPVTDYITGHSPDLWKRIAKKQIGYHTKGHKLSYSKPMSLAELEEDFKAFQDYIRIKIGDPNYNITVARAPYYAWTPEFVMLAKNHNLWLAQATVSPADLGWETLLGVIRNNGNGGILISHSTEKDALWWKMHAAKLKNLNYKFRTVEQVFGR